MNFMHYNYNKDQQDTICALATAGGVGAIAVIRMSGKDAFAIGDKIFKTQKGTKIVDAKGYSILYGKIIDENIVIDEVLISVFRNPHSYTGEDTIEISCHGSIYIQQQILQLLISNGARHAQPGEYTMRAFFNGKLDLSQAEAVADLIASHSKASHTLAMNQMRGGFSDKIKTLRQQLIEFASLIELELDFGEEDVEFADRNKFATLLSQIKQEITVLTNSFSLGNVLKNGIPIAIVGKPNVGKSTLLNALLNEERAIVSEIAGTTRDTIEDVININGITFRFIDTAGLRTTSDIIETAGIERTLKKVEQAHIILYIFDISQDSLTEVETEIKELLKFTNSEHKKLIVIANMTDKLVEIPSHFKEFVEWETIFISAKRNENINLIIESLLNSAQSEITDSNSTIVSNARHFDALKKSLESIENIEEGMFSNLSGDLIAIDIRTALYYLSEITGEIANDDILGAIFSKFCIGK